MRYSDWLGTNFKMNSDGQLRHFNCTIPRQRKRARAGEREGEKERERGTSGGKSESAGGEENAHRKEGGEAETARKRRKTDRGCAVYGVAAGVAGGWTGTRNDRPSAHAYNYNNIT